MMMDDWTVGIWRSRGMSRLRLVVQKWAR